MDNPSSFYDQCWTHWDSHKPIGATARHTRRIIKRLLAGLSANTVLDVGCGDGLLLEKVREQFPQAEFHGTEFSPLALEKARLRSNDITLSMLDLSAQHLDRTFDLVLCIDVIEHIENDVDALSNLFAMTGKYLIIAVPLGPLFEYERRYIGHIHGYSRREFEQKLHVAGFQIQKSVQWGFPFYDIVRRLSQKSLAAPRGVAAELSGKKRFVWTVLYYLYYLSIPGIGERYFALLSKGL